MQRRNCKSHHGGYEHRAASIPTAVASRQAALWHQKTLTNREVNAMHRQTAEFAVTRKNGIITRIGKTGISQPKAKHKGGSVQFYKDRRKQSEK